MQVSRQKGAREMARGLKGIKNQFINRLKDKGIEAWDGNLFRP